MDVKSLTEEEQKFANDLLNLNLNEELNKREISAEDKRVKPAQVPVTTDMENKSTSAMEVHSFRGKLSSPLDIQIAPKNSAQSADHLSQNSQLDLQIQPDIRLMNKLKNLASFINTQERDKWILNNNKFLRLVFHLQYEVTFDLQPRNAKASEWRKLENKVNFLHTTIHNQDKELQRVKKNATFQTLEAEINALLDDSNCFTDTPLYKDVLNCAREYKRKRTLAEKRQSFKAFKGAIQTYALNRFKPKYKTTKGENRMKRMSRLMATIVSLESNQEFLDAMILEENKRLFVRHKYFHKANKLARFNPQITSIGSNNWWMLMLPYNEDSLGNVSEFTKPNLEMNNVLIASLKTKDPARRLGAMCGLFLKLHLENIDHSSFFDEKTVNLIFDRMHPKDSMSLLTPTCLLHLLEEEYARVWKNKNPVMEYMIHRLKCRERLYIWRALVAYEKKLGIDENELNCMDQTRRTFNDDANERYQASLDQEIKRRLREAKGPESSKYAKRDNKMEDLITKLWKATSQET